MSEEAPTATSALAVAEPADQPSSPPRSTPRSPPAPEGPSLKRRQSDTSDTEPKRRRLSTDDSAPPAAAPTEPRQDERRKSRQVEERKRGQRLFGALIGTLSQGSSNAAQKRRADIEKRQQAKLKQQDEEDSQRRQERLANLKTIRRKEQKKRDEKTMKLRHANLLHFAKFLRTKTEPRLYYKPWELTRDQEDQIKEQIEEAHATIERELEEFERRKAEDREEGEQTSERTEGQDAHMAESEQVGAELTKEAAEPASHEHDETANLAVPPDDTGSAHTNADDSSATAFNESIEEEMKDTADDEHGETVVEGDEDTVIY